MEESEVHLLDYLKVIYKRKWLILAIMIIAIALGASRVYRSVSVYRSVCTIRIGDRTSTAIHSGKVIEYTNPWVSEKNINTHIHIMMSDPVLEEVAKSLNRNTPSNSTRFLKPIKSF